MYTPHFSYTDKLVSALVKLEQNKTLLQTLDLPYEVKFKLIRNSKALNFFHISNMLYKDITLKDAEKIIDGNKRLEEFDNEQNKILMNLKSAMDFIRSNVSDNFPEFEKSIIIEINKIMLKNWRETWEADYRNFNDAIDIRWDNFAKFRDLDITGQMVGELMDELIDWYKYSINSITPAVRISILIYRLFELTPFLAGNKFSILVIFDYLLYKNGFSSKVFSSTIRSIHLIEEKLERLFPVVEQTNDLTLWIETIVTALNSELINVREEIHNFVVSEEKSKKQPFLDLNKRQMKVLKYLQSVPTIQREEYCHMFEVSTMTAFRDLTDLYRKKLIKIEGKARSTKYKLATN